MRIDIQIKKNRKENLATQILEDRTGFASQ
jgi:hypothetical protein